MLGAIKSHETLQTRYICFSLGLKISFSGRSFMVQEVVVRQSAGWCNCSGTLAEKPPKFSTYLLRVCQHTCISPKLIPNYPDLKRALFNAGGISEVEGFSQSGSSDFFFFFTISETCSFRFNEWFLECVKARPVHKGCRVFIQASI